MLVSLFVRLLKLLPIERTSTSTTTHSTFDMTTHICSVYTLLPTATRRALYFVIFFCFNNIVY